MARKQKDDAGSPPPALPVEPARTPGLVVVINPFTLSLPWPPFYPRGGVGTVLFEDDPLLDTTQLPDDVVRDFKIERGSQRHKVSGAPEGATVTPTNDPRLAGLYARLGYTRVPYANPEAPKEPDATPEIRKEPEEALGDADLEVPKRDDESPGS